MINNSTELNYIRKKEIQNYRDKKKNNMKPALLLVNFQDFLFNRNQAN